MIHDELLVKQVINTLHHSLHQAACSEVKTITIFS